MLPLDLMPAAVAPLAADPPGEAPDDAPAILITTGPSTDLRRKAAAAGAPIVEKPLLDDALFTQIRRLVARD